MKTERDWVELARSQSVQRELPPLPPPLPVQDGHVPDGPRIADYLRECAASAAMCEQYRKVRSLPLESLQFASLDSVAFPLDEPAPPFLSSVPPPGEGKQAVLARQVAFRRHVPWLEIRAADGVIAGFIAAGQLGTASTGAPGSKRWRAARDSLLAQAARESEINRQRSIAARHAKVAEHVRAALAHSSLSGSKSLFDPVLSEATETAPLCECGCESDGRVANGWAQGGATGMIPTEHGALWLMRLYRIAMFAAVLAIAPVGMQFLFGGAAPDWMPISATLLVAAIVVTRVAIHLLWMLWSGSVAVNARVLGSAEAPSRLSIVGWWFVPLANLIMPYRKMGQLVKSLRWFGGGQVQEAPLLRWWWLGVVGAYVASGFIPRTHQNIQPVIAACYHFLNECPGETNAYSYAQSVAAAVAAAQAATAAANFSVVGLGIELSVLALVVIEAVFGSRLIHETERRQALWIGRKLRGDPDPRVLGTTTSSPPIARPASAAIAAHAEATTATAMEPRSQTRTIPQPQPQAGEDRQAAPRFCGVCGAAQEQLGDLFCRSCGQRL